MNPDYSNSFEQDVGGDALPELDYVAPPVSRDNEESNENENDCEFSEEDGPPMLEDFHEKMDQRLNFNATTESAAEINSETHTHNHEMYSDYNCQIKPAAFSERYKANCFRSKEPSFTGHSFKRNNDSFGEHHGFVESRSMVVERDRRGTSHRYHMIDADDYTDNFDSEKDDDKMDEDDDDLTKKLLSIQVLPRIPKIKRTGMSVGGASCESSVPQRSVLERAEFATKSSSYPKWPKSNGGQVDDKQHRWHSERKGRDTKQGSRNRKETELRTNSSFAHSRPSGSNFRRPLDFEKSKSNPSERVPCELLFDSVVKKEDSSQVPSSSKKDSNDFDSDGLFGSASDSADSKIYSDFKDKDLCGSKDQQTPKLLTEEDRRWRRMRGDNIKRKEGKLENRESASSSKVSDVKSQENFSIDQSNSCHNSDKHLLPEAFQDHGSCNLGISLHQNGSLSDIKLPAISNERTNLASSDATQMFSQSVPLSTSLIKSEDAHFKRPSVSRAPRSKLLENSVEHASSNRHHSNFKASTMNWNESGRNEQSKPKSPTIQNDSPLPQPVQISPNQLDSVMEVVDMDVCASPLCDDKLLSCEPSIASTSGARKVVTFDCPEDVDNARRNNSKTSKREKATQQASFETKCDIQKQVVSEMKELLRPLYSKRKINKEEYKEIMRQAVPKLCHNRKTRVASSRIKKYAEKYTSRILKLNKKSSSQTEKQSAVSVAPSFV